MLEGIMNMLEWIISMLGWIITMLERIINRSSAEGQASHFSHSGHSRGDLTLTLRTHAQLYRPPRMVCGVDYTPSGP
eukprot:996850-Prorocentrum_minimum.AAC.4